MNKKIANLLLIGLLYGSGISRADFKYTESAKITGGMMAGMMKFAGALSKDAQKANEPIESTTMVKGNRMRTEGSEGKAQIIDLDGRRMIDIDTKARTYSVATFDQIKAALQEAQARAKRQQGDAKNPDVKMTPKIETSSTGIGKVILDQPAKEYKVKMEMEMQTDDPKYKGQSASFWFTSDAWVAALIKGYDEVRQFHQRLAKELDWLPGAVFGGNVRVSPAMTEFRKNTDNMNGFPLLQYASFGMGETAPPGESGAGSQAQSARAAQRSQSSDQVTPGDTTAKAIGSMLGGIGGFGRKKKKQTESAQQSEESSTASTSAAPPAGAFASGSLMDMTVEVTGFSNGSLDSSLFEIPAGYTQVQEDADQILGNKRR